MRDTDCDLTSVIVVSADSSPITDVADLPGSTVATGAVDSPQSTLLPLDHLAPLGLEPGDDFTVRRFDVGVGLHGDHVGGERDAAGALAAGDGRRGVHDRRQPAPVQPRRARSPAGSTRILAADRAVRPLQHDGAGRRPPTGSSPVSASSCCRWTTTIPRCARCSTSRACKQWRPGRAQRLRAARGRRSTTAGFYDARRVDHRRRLSTLKRLGRLGSRAAHSHRRRRPSARPADRRPARRPRHATPTCGSHLATWAAQPGSPASSAGRRRDRGRGRTGRSRPARWTDAERAAAPDRRRARSAPPAAGVGLAARGAPCRSRRPPLTGSDLADEDELWSDLAPAPLRPGGGRPVGSRDGDRLGRRRSISPRAVEAAVVQVMTYLVENEQAALLVPARFLGRDPSAFPRGDAAAGRPGRRRGPPRRGLHPTGHCCRGGPLGTSAVGGRSLAADPARRAGLPGRLASCCPSSARAPSSPCSSFLEHHGPDPVTRRIAHLALQDESRHVAFGIGPPPAPPGLRP